MKRIVVTGALGQLGVALSRLFMGTGYELFFTARTPSMDATRKVLDITDEVAVFDFINDIHPEVIINCAAFTAVDLCENEEERAYRVNALGPKYLAMAAAVVGAKLIHVSTDYVYDGQASVPYCLGVWGRKELCTNDASSFGKRKANPRGFGSVWNTDQCIGTGKNNSVFNGDGKLWYLPCNM
jgi:dTDP-4-dehydrorhamnose reductase